jgi:hypothetical protein
MAGSVGRSTTPGAASKVSSLVSWLWAPAKLQKHMTKNILVGHLETLAFFVVRSSSYPTTSVLLFVKMTTLSLK